MFNPKMKVKILSVSFSVGYRWSNMSNLMYSVGMIYALVVITMVCRKKVSVRIKSLITSAVT